MDHRGTSPRRCLDGTWCKVGNKAGHVCARCGVKQCVFTPRSGEKTPTWRWCWSQAGRFHLRPCHGLQLPSEVRGGRTRRGLLAPGSCSGCSRQLANALGRKPPGRCTRRADSSPSLRWNSPRSLADPRQRTNPTKEVPNAAEPSCVQTIGCPVRQAGPQSSPPSSLRLPATILGKLARDVTSGINRAARGETTDRGRCAAPRCDPVCCRWFIAIFILHVPSVRLG